MPRRAPPTPLRLYEGPLPPRSRPRHTLPSVPRPTYVARVPVAKGPRPRPRAQIEMMPIVLTVDNRDHEVSHSRNSSWSGSDGSCSPVSVISDGGSASLSRRSSYESLELSDEGREGALRLRERGPWDHSSSIRIPFDVSAVLAAPRPVVVNVPAVH